MSTAGADAPGTLHIVSTPIGNLGDLTPRAVETMRAVNAILAEDTRHSRILAERFDIRTPMVAYHEHVEATMTPKLVARLLAGESLALITDAGTPLLSDPGARLVRAAIDAGVRVSPVPGASALLAALVAAGIAADRFTFLGFLARKGGERSGAIAGIVASPHTMVLYEAPNRVGETLGAIAEAMGPSAASRDAVVARELTKQYEEFRRGTVAELAAYYRQEEVRGEVVLVIAGAPQSAPDEDSLRARAAELRASGRSTRDVVQALVAEGAPRNLAYRIAHE